jgi:lipopolysaccharide/colanic/teichoic acid biosynthesis glycosyltransferase
MNRLTPALSSHFELAPAIPGAEACANLTADLESDLTEEMPTSARSWGKRFIDVAGALVGLVILSPLMLVIAVLVRLDSPGPALFRQVRLGLAGRPFWCLKFRTMATDAERRLREFEAMNEIGSGVLFKIRHDPRVTRLGRFLRMSSLDELPQLLNVLYGEMTLVGPRPLQLRDSRRLMEFAGPQFGRRLSVTPGLTGPWQVSGRSQLDIHDMLNLDIKYIENWSIIYDILIIIKTVNVVLSGRGAS